MPTIREAEESVSQGGAGVVGATEPAMSSDAPTFVPAGRIHRDDEDIAARRAYIVEATEEIKHAPEPTNNTIYDP
eukprot:12909416-Prorocentrum_lima.AAC.1